MKLRVKVPAVFIALSLIAVPCWAQQRPAAQPVSLKPVAPNVYLVLGGAGARGGAYVGDNGVVLIDAKQDQASASQVLAEISKLTDKPLKYVINTHSDGDHVYGNRFLPASAVFIAQENCRAEFFHANRDGSPAEWSKPELAAFVPGITFRERMNVYLGSKRIELWYFGVGHTTGDAVVYLPGEKVAFIGDQAFVTRPQLIHSYKGGNSFEHVKTLSKMLDTLDAERFFAGHEEVLDRAAIRKHIEQMTAMQDKVKSLLAQNKTVDEIKAQFAANEAALVGSICQELNPGKP